MGAAYIDRINRVTALRHQIMLIQNQIDDEIARAYRLSPVKSLEIFAPQVGLNALELAELLLRKGIVPKHTVYSGSAP